MAALFALFLVGSAARLALLVLRPSAEQRFRQRRRRLIARRTEQVGDVIVMATGAGMVVFGFGHRPGRLLMAVWALGLLMGFAAAFLAHDVARRAGGRR